MIRELKRSGEKLPDEIKNKPELKTDFVFYLDAFFELSTDRPASLGIQPIPFSSIARFCEVYEIPRYEFPVFSFIIRSIDSEYMKLQKEKTDAGKSA